MNTDPRNSSMRVPAWWKAVVTLGYSVALFVAVILLVGKLFGTCAENASCSPLQSGAALLLLLTLGAGLLIVGVLGWKGWLPGTRLNKQHEAGASLRRSSVTAAVLLTFVSRGFYKPFWFYTRTAAINSLASPAKLWRSGPAVLLIFQILFLLAPRGTVLQMLLGLAVGVTVLVLSFRVRSIIADDLSSRAEAVLPVSLGVQALYAPSTLLTLFFDVWYLQYKLNDLIDQRRAWETPVSVEIAPETIHSLPALEVQ
jgi:Domain of unknown function (DUF4234)